MRPQKTVSFDYTPHKDTLVTQIASNKKRSHKLVHRPSLQLIEHLQIDPLPQGLLFIQTSLVYYLNVGDSGDTQGSPLHFKFLPKCSVALEIVEKAISQNA